MEGKNSKKSGNIQYVFLAVICLVVILNKIMTTNDKGGIDEEYFTLCANMIFYINYKEGHNNLLSRYIATSLV